MSPSHRFPRVVLLSLDGFNHGAVSRHPEVRAKVEDLVVDGGSALALVQRGVSVFAAGAALQSAPDVTGWREIRPGVLLVCAHPGVRFASNPDKAVRGVHGGPGSTATLALVTGGHPAARRIAAAITMRPPHLADWAPTIAAVLGVPFPSAEGWNLLA